MKKGYFIAIAAALILQPAQNIAAQNVAAQNAISRNVISQNVISQSDGKSELANMNALYEYAWSLDYPQQASYDNTLEKTEAGTIRTVKTLPAATIGYQVQDYDGDDQMELLVVRSNPTQQTNQSQLIFQIYEANEGKVVFASEVTAEIPSFATGIGKIRVYSRDAGDKILIGCDQYEEGFLWDGLTMKTSYYSYNGVSLTQDSSMEVAGSIVDDAYMIDEYSKIGLNSKQVATITDGKTAYDCIPGTELIAETNVESSFDIYLSWSNTASQGDTVAVGTASIACYSWFPGEKPAIAQKQESSAPSDQPAQDPIERLANWADYLYIISDFETMQIYSMYYLIPDEGVTKYDCYQTDGTYISSIPYANAKSIIDSTMMSDSFDLPSGEREMLVWNSPYGLCAYSRVYKDYYPWYSTDANGNYIENYPDVSQFPYELSEADIHRELDALGLPDNIVIPTSHKTE